jgi:hypothetical protein
LKERWKKQKKTRKRHKQLLEDLKEKRGYWKLKEETPDGTTSKIGFGRGCGTVARQTRTL